MTLPYRPLAADATPRLVETCPRRGRRGSHVAGLLIALGLCAVPLRSGSLANGAPVCTLDRATGTTIDPQPFLPHASGTRWNLATDLIAFSQPDARNRSRIFIVRPDKSGRRALASDLPGHQGAPYWSPDGRYLLFTSQKPGWSGRTLFGIPDYEALPGFGRHDDMWVVAIGSGNLRRLTDDPDTRDQGVLLPVFSPDGRQVAWSARQPGGTYVLKLADFVATPNPHLVNVRSYQPGGPAYYETGSFTSDGRSLFYTSDQDTRSFWHSQIYRLDLATGESRRMTPGDDYNEHPTVVRTPTGDWVIYMSTKGVDRYPWHLLLGTDWYAMRAAGGAAKRLTEMNVNRPDNPENEGRMLVAGTIAIAPSGAFMLGDVQDSIIRQTGFVRTVRFACR